MQRPRVSDFASVLERWFGATLGTCEDQPSLIVKINCTQTSSTPVKHCGQLEGKDRVKRVGRVWTSGSTNVEVMTKDDRAIRK